MITFIKLTKATGIKFWLNINNIIAIYNGNTGSKIETNAKEYTFIDVIEEPSEIFNLMHGEIPNK